MFTTRARYMAPRVQAQSGGPASAVLAGYVRSNLEFIRDHPKEIAAVTEIVAAVRTKEGSPRFTGGPGGIERALEPLQEVLRRGQAEGDFADFDTRTMAWAIRHLIDSAPRQRALDPQFDFDTCITELTALVDRATRKVAS